MNPSWFRQRMLANFDALNLLLDGLSEEQAHWRPDEQAWSIVEIINHMADEEAEDFRARLTSTLADPKRSWKPIDPPAWVKERNYQSTDLSASLERLSSVRGFSLTVLSLLINPDWNRSYDHPLLGSISAADLLVSWHAHDLLHLRQISRRLFELGAVNGEAKADYAGKW